MNASTILLTAAGAGFIVNILFVLGIAWRGGLILGRIDSTLGRLMEDSATHRTTQESHTQLITRAVVQLEDLERRVGALERPHNQRAGDPR